VCPASLERDSEADKQGNHGSHCEQHTGTIGAERSRPALRPGAAAIVRTAVSIVPIAGRTVPGEVR
jgi:hypothetical protein